MTRQYNLLPIKIDRQTVVMHARNCWCMNRKNLPSLSHCMPDLQFGVLLKTKQCPKAHCLMRCRRSKEQHWRRKNLHLFLRYCSINHHPCVLYDHECTGRSSKFGGNVRTRDFIHHLEYYQRYKILSKLITWELKLISRLMIFNSATGWRMSLPWWKTSPMAL